MLSYMLYAPWLLRFSPPAAAGVCVLYFAFCALLFLCLKLADTFCGRLAWAEEALIFCAYEYLKTTGFFGFSYGVSAYTQWRNIPLIQCSRLFGVWGISALIHFFAAWVYAVALSAGERRRNTGASASLCLKSALSRHAAGGAAWLLCLIAALAYGFAVSGKEPPRARIKVAAVQNNSDPWKGGLDVFREDVRKLTELTDQALAAEPDIQIVVWPETAVVPSVLKNYYMRGDRARYELVRDLLLYIDSKSCCFVIGNYHAEEYEGRTDEYNCVFLFVPGENVIPPRPERYAKMHLVPCTESFPFREIMPRVYQALLAGDTHLWTAGRERKVFSARGLDFAAPVCFEDTFGDDCRKFVRLGARAFVNLSNDAWSKSLRCQYQHLAMAVFRSAENGVPSVRSTASGQTCLIDSAGRIQAMSAPFEENYVTGEIAVPERGAAATLYSRIGDAAGIAAVAAAAVFLLAGIVLSLARGAAGLRRAA